MTLSVANNSGSTDPKDIPYGRFDSFKWEAFEEYGGSKQPIFRSVDGKIVAGAAKESGTATTTYPCDELFYVVQGWIKCTVHGGDVFTLGKGGCTYFTKGTTVDFEFGDNLTNVAVFIDQEKRITLV
jgi:uncharacterized cupin superfamily protein